VRQYSLCGDDQDRTSYTVAVLHEPAGRGGSREVHTTALVGTQLKVSGPRNHFPLAQASEHLLIAGGIGITPILAMARALQRAGQPWHAVYCGHHGDMAFTDELRALDAERTTIVATDRSGRPDLKAMISALPEGAAVYCCGPPSLIADVTACCTREDLTLHVERFTADPAATKPPAGEDRPFEVELAATGASVTVAPDQTILDAVREVRPDVLSSCEEGFCGTCETRVLVGIPDHRDEVLGAAEHAQNRTMMICVSRARSDRLVLDL
jgi:ferredoxin-NADP reductase